MQTGDLGMRSFAQAALAIEVMDHEKVGLFPLDKKSLQNIIIRLKDSLITSGFFVDLDEGSALDHAETAGLVKLYDHLLFRQNVDLSLSVMNGIKRNWLAAYRRGGKITNKF